MTAHSDRAAPTSLRIVVADDQASVREGLVVLLGLLPDIEVVGSAANGEQALQVVGRTRPDAILLDLHMPVLDGIETTRRLTSEHPDVAVVILTTFADDSSILAALQAGARSYLTKDADRAEIGKGATPQAPRRADAAGSRDPAPDRPGQGQPRHRGRSLSERAHRQEPHQPDLRQDRLAGPRRRHQLRPRARPGLAAPVNEVCLSRPRPSRWRRWRSCGPSAGRA
jgi:DNA-binding NarL/FixJ family response regulator